MNMDYFTKKEQLFIVFILVIIFLISIFYYINDKLLSFKEEDSQEIEEILKGLEEDIRSEEAGYIMVHVSGQVYNPGIVELKAGSRVIDAINLAGGLKKDADSDKINLARKLSDEEKIHVPKVGEEDFDHSLSTSSNDGEGKININTCTKEQLTTLPGIGEVLADRIIQYREDTPFKSIEDIMNVSGIGEKKFEGIKDLIIVR